MAWPAQPFVASTALRLDLHSLWALLNLVLHLIILTQVQRPAWAFGMIGTLAAVSISASTMLDSLPSHVAKAKELLSAYTYLVALTALQVAASSLSDHRVWRFHEC